MWIFAYIFDQFTWMRKNQTVYADCRDNQYDHISMGFVNGNSPNNLRVMEVESNLRPN